MLLIDSPEAAQTIVDPRDAAESVGLRYVSDERPGIRRKKVGTGFRYVRPDGSKSRHGAVEGNEVRFLFTGKGGKQWSLRVRDRRIAKIKGVTINGLPIMMKEPSFSSSTDVRNLDAHYENCIIGGPGSFVVPIKDRCQIKEAIRTKLVLEVSSQTPEWKTVPVVEELRVNCWPEKKCTTIGGGGDGLSRINTAGGGTGAHILLSGIS